MERQDAWELARTLVTREGKSYAQAAELTGLSLSTLEKRAARENWQAQRDTATAYSATVREMKRLILERLTAAAIDPNSDPQEVAQLVHAWRGAEVAFPEKTYAGGVDKAQARSVVVGFLDTAVRYLGAKDPVALRVLQPHIEPMVEAWDAGQAA